MFSSRCISELSQLTLVVWPFGRHGRTLLLLGGKHPWLRSLFRVHLMAVFDGIAGDVTLPVLPADRDD